MKKLLTILLITLTGIASAQYSETTLNYTYDTSDTYPNDSTNVKQIDIDGDGVYDFRVTAWFGHTVGIESAIEVVSLDPVYLGGLDVQDCNMIRQCDAFTFDHDAVSAYLYSSDCSNGFSPGEYQLPITFNSSGIVRCGFFYAKYSGTTVTLKGYAFRYEPGEDCKCDDIGLLSLNELSSTKPLGQYSYYYPDGRLTDDPHGIALKVYENGHVERVFIE